MCDKPVTHDLAQASDLVARTAAKDRVSRSRTATRPTRWWLRAAPRAGRPPSARCASCRSSTSRAAWPRASGGRPRRTTGFRWLLDPARSGLALVMSAIGCHAQHLGSFVAGAPGRPRDGDVGTLLPGRKVGRLRLRADRASTTAPARHVHRDAGRGRRRERHPPARLRRQGHARVVASRPVVPAHRDAGRAGAGGHARRSLPAAGHRRDEPLATRPSGRAARASFATLYGRWRRTA